MRPARDHAVSPGAQLLWLVVVFIGTFELAWWLFWDLLGS